MSKSIFLILSLLTSQINTQGIITYDPEKLGRIGDRLMLYTKALWIAHHYKIPFHHKSFSFLNDHATLQQSDDKINLKPSNQVESFPQFPIVTIKDSSLIKEEENKTYNISYYYKESNWADPLDVVTWTGLSDNEQFLEKLRIYIAPIFTFEKITLPPDRISIALHVRKGSGSELPLCSRARPCADRIWPKKFVHDEYFITQIKYISEQLKDRPIYIHLFTDFHNPLQLVEKYKKAVNKPNIIYGCRLEGNDHCTNTLEDLFNMTHFDYLIRSGSNYAQIAHLIGKYKMIIYPKKVTWHGNKMKVEPGIVERVF